MQAQGNLIERIVQAYVASRGVRVLCVLAVLVSAPLLYVLAGGFPPYAWRLLGQTLPQLSILLALRGPVVLLALSGLLLLSITLLLAWFLLLWLSWRMFAYWRYERRELRKFAADAEEAYAQAEEYGQQNEEEDFEAQPVHWQSGRVTLPVTRRRVLYPLSPLPASFQEEEDNPGQSADDAAGAGEPFFLEDEEEEEYNMAVYRDEEEDDEKWYQQAASRAENMPGVSRAPYRQQRAGSPAPASAAAPDGSSDQVHTSYGRILPFSAAPSAGALPYLTSTLYDRVSLPHSVSGPVGRPDPSAQQPTFLPSQQPSAKQPAVAPRRIELAQPSSASAPSAKQPAVAPRRIELAQPSSALVQTLKQADSLSMQAAKQQAAAPSSQLPAAFGQSPQAPDTAPHHLEPTPGAPEVGEDAKRVPILPISLAARGVPQFNSVFEQPVKQAAEPAPPSQLPAAYAQAAPEPAVTSSRQKPAPQPEPRPAAPMQPPVVPPAAPRHQAGTPMQAPAPRAVSAWLDEPPVVAPGKPEPAATPGQPGAVQSLMELISTVPMGPQPARVELVSTIPMQPPLKEPIPLAPPLGRAEAVARPAITQLVVSTGLDVGLKRRGRPNEDSLLALQNTRILRGGSCPVGLFVVADGMGGHENGQEASNLVVQSLSKNVMPSIIYGPTDDNYSELLAEGVHHANLEIYQRNRQAKVDMGTTIVAALIIGTTAYIVSAGDSRVYLYRASSGLTQVTRDHSTVARLVENGLLKPEEVYTHPRRNEIYRSLGHHPSEDLDKFLLALQPDDVLLLCSDGLWEMVRDNHIREIIASTAGQPAQTSAALVQAALDGGGKDNISVIVVYVKAALSAQTAWAG